MFLPETATLAFRELMSTSVPDKVNHFKNTLDELFPFTGITEISRSSSGYFREKKHRRWSQFYGIPYSKKNIF